MKLIIKFLKMFICLVPLVNIVEECVKKVPTFCGVKYTDYDLLAFGRCLLNKVYGSKLTMAYGRDEVSTSLSLLFMFISYYIFVL